MIKSILPIFPLLLTFISHSNAQNISWNETSNWKLYKLNSRDAFSYVVDTLHNFKSRNLNDKIMHDFLSSAKMWPQDKKAVWMGLLIASYETKDKKVHKINISNYGGFFLDEFSNRYYQLPESVRNEWIGYLNDEMDKLFAE